MYQSNVTRSVVAEVLGLSTPQINRLTKDGHIPQVRRGTYDLPAVVRAYIKYKSAAAGDPNKLVITAEKAKKLVRDRRVTERKLITKPVHDAGAMAMIAAFRYSIGALPGRLPPVLVGKDAQAMRAVIESEVAATTETVFRAYRESLLEIVGAEEFARLFPWAKNLEPFETTRAALVAQALLADFDQLAKNAKAGK